MVRNLKTHQWFGSGAIVAAAFVAMNASAWGQEATPLRMQAIAGLTTGVHVAPAHATVPQGASVRFVQSFPSSGPVGSGLGSGLVWVGAEEVSRTDSESVAECFFNESGTYDVAARMVTGSGRVEWQNSCRVSVVSTPVDRIGVENVDGYTRVIHVTQGTPFNVAYDYFSREDSIAGLQTVEPANTLRRLDGRRSRRAQSKSIREGEVFVTSVDRTITLNAAVNMRIFSDVVEWRVDGRPFALGQSAEFRFATPGRHTISVGPPRNARELTLDVYSVEITSHINGTDFIRQGVPVTFEAVTNPPGFEEYITWIATTKFGTMSTVAGAGRTFTVRFDDTVGDDPDNGRFQWLGVRADNVAFGQDQKAGACILPDAGCEDALGLRILPTACFDLGGSFFGALTTCAADCEPAAACCLPDGTCTETGEEWCTGRSGTWQGVPVECATKDVVVIDHAAQAAGGCGHRVETVLIWGLGGGPAGSCDPVLGDRDFWKTAYDAQGTCLTFGSASVPAIPSGFFGTGSDPFSGTVCFLGASLEIPGAGIADTVILRTGPDPFAPCDPIGANQTVPIEIVELSLRSIDPISVGFNSGATTEQWDVAIGLSPGGQAAGSVLTASKTHCNGGTFDTTLNIDGEAAFTQLGSQGAPLTLDLGTQVLQSAGGPWVHQIGPVNAHPPGCSGMVYGLNDPVPGADCPVCP